MSNYNFLHNPQTEFWKNKYEELLSEVTGRDERLMKHFQETLENERFMISDWITELNKSLTEARLDLRECQLKMELFNDLPWYEKMFFKFNLNKKEDERKY